MLDPGLGRGEDTARHGSSSCQQAHREHRPHRLIMNSSPERWASLSLLFLTLLLVATLPVSSTAQPSISIPGNPKGDLKTELLQSVTAVRSMEATLRHVLKNYPSLKVEAVSAQASWGYSPFAKGARYIEEDIRKDAGDNGQAMIDEIDKISRDAVKTYAPVDTLAKAREFIELVNRRAKGGIEVPMVRGTLLWNCPTYQTKPEQEILDGYVLKESSTKDGVVASVEWPISWKAATARNPKILQKYQNQWGHGKLSGMLRIDTIPLLAGVTAEPDQMWDEATEEIMREEWKPATVLSFKKTRHRGLPVLLLGVVLDIEQLGMKLKMVQMTLAAYHRNISAQVTCSAPVAPGDDPEAVLKKYEPLFLSVVSSFHVSFPGDERAAGGAASVPERAPAAAPTRPTTSTSASAAAAGFEMFSSPDFHFAIRMPGDVQVTKATTQFGDIGSFKALDEKRLCIHAVTVNRIDAFVEDEKKFGEKEWKGVIDSNFKGWTKGYPIQAGTLQSSKIVWQKHEAIRYSFICVDFVEKGVTSYHRGVTFLHKGCFYNIAVWSFVGGKEAAEDLAQLESTLLLDVSIGSR